MDRKQFHADNHTSHKLHGFLDSAKANRAQKEPTNMKQRYNLFYWCSLGQHWIARESVVKASNGRLLCPMHKRGVRTRRKMRKT